MSGTIFIFKFNVPNREVSELENVRFEKSENWVSGLEIDRIEKCQNWKFQVSKNAVTENAHNCKLSELKSVGIVNF